MREFKCIKCGQGESDGAEFQPDPNVKRGHKASCKVCTSIAAKEWYRNKGGKKKTLDRIRMDRSKSGGRGADEKYRVSIKGKNSLRRYQQSEGGKANQAKYRQTATYKSSQTSYRERYPEKYQANYLLRNAVRDGRVIRPSACEKCGAGGKVQGHHEDYAFPLEVDWWCNDCHKRYHRNK